jgi:hypothetical protein
MKAKEKESLEDFREQDEINNTEIRRTREVRTAVFFIMLFKCL